MDPKVEKLSFKEKRKIFKRTVTDIHKMAPGLLAGKSAVYFFDALGSFVPIYLSGLIIDGISGGKTVEDVLMLIVLSIGVAFLLQTAEQCFDKLFYAKANQLSMKSEMRISEKVLSMDYTKLEDPAVHRQIDRINDINSNFFLGIYMSVVTILSHIVYGITSVAAALVMTADLFAYVSAPTGNSIFMDLLVPAIILLILLSLVIENIRRSKTIIKKEEIQISDRMVGPRRIMNCLGGYLWEYQSVKDIQLYRQQDFILKRIDELWQKISYEHDKADRIQMKQSVFEGVFGLVRSVMIYTFVALKAMAGAISAGAVIKDVQSFFRLQSEINIVVTKFTFLDTHFFPLKQIYEFLDLPDEKYKGSIPTEKRDDDQYEFEFKHVYFKYPKSDQYVLKDINLKWRIGEKMALVGRNGCGKSTLVKLLCRLYDPTEGVITLNGIDIKKYKYEEYMALFSVVFQDSRLFSFSMAENVAASSQYDSERVRECIVRAGMGDRLDKMENGIETCLYKDFDEKGVEISGGEAQKLCLARAVYKGAPFIVLDEPTAALDPVSEHDIYTKFNDIVGTKTAIYISHRLSSCRFCDEITVMDNGSIREKGTHAELLQRKGVYSSLWTAQAEYYKDTAGELFA